MHKSNSNVTDVASPLAVVVGLCAHGLAIARALHRAGIEVLAIESNALLPGAGTRTANVEFVSSIEPEKLVDTLVELAKYHGWSNPPVLFLTNDLMVEAVGRRCQEIIPYYRLSWAHASEMLLPLLSKKNIESRCLETNLNYPRSCLIENLDSDLSRITSMHFPLILKPIRPLSLFKTLIARELEDILSSCDKLLPCLPVLAQEFIPGDDRSIRFGALYLHNGEVLARFEGRKLRSRPMGHTTIAVSEIDDSIHELAVRFFQGIKLSGPVSVEFKRSPDGRQWVIEPTVGRTDFWVGLCVANGVNLPLVEYDAVSGRLPKVQLQTNRYIWINGDRDPGAIMWLLWHSPATLARSGIAGVYFSARDIKPFITATVHYVVELPARFARKIARMAAVWA